MDIVISLQTSIFISKYLGASLSLSRMREGFFRLSGLPAIRQPDVHSGGQDALTRLPAIAAVTNRVYSCIPTCILELGSDTKEMVNKKLCTIIS